jgi:hypothetical protein
MDAVHIDVGHQARAVELEIEAPAGEGRIHGEVPPVPARAATVVVAAVLSVQRVPRVGKVDRLPGAVVEAGFRGAGVVAGEESPARVEVQNLPAIGKPGGLRRAMDGGGRGGSR